MCIEHFFTNSTKKISDILVFLVKKGYFSEFSTDEIPVSTEPVPDVSNHLNDVYSDGLKYLIQCITFNNERSQLRGSYVCWKCLSLM